MLNPEKLDTNEFSYNNGYIKYRDSYSIFVYRPFFQLPDEKKYIIDIFQSIMFDRLHLVKTILIKDPAPVKITYPADNKLEDPLTSYLDDNSPKPGKFDFRVQLQSAFPQGIRDPVALLSNRSLAGLLSPEDFHMVSTIKKQNENFIMHVYIFRNGLLVYENELTSLEIEISRKIVEFGGKVATSLTAVETGVMNVVSNVDKSSVYLNDQYMGYAPVLLSDAPVGNNTITVRKEGYKTWTQPTVVEKGQQLNISANLEKHVSIGKLQVTSSQEKCDVYMDAKYLGQTPVSIENVLPGYHRVRIRKEGFIDNYQTIKVDTENTEFHVFAELISGKSEQYYDIHRKVLGDYNFEQLYKASAFMTMIGGIGGIFFLVERQNAESSILTYQYNFTQRTATAVELANYKAYQKNKPVFQSLETGFFIGSGVFLISTIYLFARFIGSQDLDIASLTPEPLSGQNTLISFNFQSQAALFSFEHRW